MKYFYYISKSKVQMLAAQARKSRFSLKSITSKLGFGPASITASVEQQPDSLVSDTLSIIDRLENSKVIRKSSDLSKRRTNGFFQDRGRWHHGLFGFRTAHPFFGDFRREPSATVVYALWRELGTSALILLIGSPNNILGEKIVSSEGVIVPGSLSAQSMIIRYVEAFLYLTRLTIERR